MKVAIWISCYLVFAVLGMGLFYISDDFAFPLGFILQGCAIFSAIKLCKKWEEYQNTNSVDDTTSNKNTQDFIIENAVLKKYTGNARHVVIPNGVISIGQNAFVGSKIDSIIISNGVKEIGNGAFSLCSNLTSVELPNSIEKIGCDAFGMCAKLSSISIPGSVTSISKSTFNGCSKLETVKIGNGVGIIDDSAFLMCSNLTNITIPRSMIRIGENAFGACINLEKVKFVDGGAYIAPGAFALCDKLTIYAPEYSNVAIYASSSNIDFIADGQVLKNNDDFCESENKNTKCKILMSFFEHMNWKPELIEIDEFLGIKIYVPVKTCLTQTDCEHIYPLIFIQEYESHLYTIFYTIPVIDNERRWVDLCLPLIEKYAKECFENDVDYIVEPDYTEDSMGISVTCNFCELPVDLEDLTCTKNIIDVVHKAVILEYTYIELLNKTQKND